MFNWLRSRSSTRLPAEASKSSPELDFTNPDQEKFAESLSSWRESLEKTVIQNKKLDQNDLTFMSPEALADLKQRDALVRKEAVLKKRVANLKANAKADKAVSKKTTAKPAPKKAAPQKTATKTSAKTAAEPTSKPATKKPIAKAASKPATKVAPKAPAKNIKTTAANPKTTPTKTAPAIKPKPAIKPATEIKPKKSTTPAKKPAAKKPVVKSPAAAPKNK